jgi:hypothetical protein
MTEQFVGQKVKSVEIVLGNRFLKSLLVCDRFEFVWICDGVKSGPISN